MIASHDRSGWFGASDVSYITGNWKTKSFADWWLIKLGIAQNHYESGAMNAGTHWEHRILESLGLEMEFDRQILIPELALRVNLDGNTEDAIYECKTHGADRPFRCPKKYRQQVQVQMFAARAAGLSCGAYGRIIYYGLMAEDYDNYFLPIDPERRGQTEIDYDGDFIEGLFLPRLITLRDCLQRGVWPDV